MKCDGCKGSWEFRRNGEGGEGQMEKKKFASHKTKLLCLVPDDLTNIKTPSGQSQDVSAVAAHYGADHGLQAT